MSSKQKPTISYDEESSIVSIRFGKQTSVDSDVQGNVVIDYDEEGGVVGIDIMGFSLDDFEREDTRSKVKNLISTS